MNYILYIPMGQGFIDFGNDARKFILNIICQGHYWNDFKDLKRYNQNANRFNELFSDFIPNEKIIEPWTDGNDFMEIIIPDGYKYVQTYDRIGVCCKHEHFLEKFDTYNFDYSNRIYTFEKNKVLIRK